MVDDDRPSEGRRSRAQVCQGGQFVDQKGISKTSNINRYGIATKCHSGRSQIVRVGIWRRLGVPLNNDWNVIGVITEGAIDARNFERGPVFG